MEIYPVVFIFLTCINGIVVSSSSIEITKSKICKDDVNSSVPCSSESIVVQTDPLHGFIISVLPFHIEEANATKGEILALPMPYKLGESVEEIFTSEEEMFIIPNSFPLDDEEELYIRNSSTVNELTVEETTTVDDLNIEEEEDCTKNCPDSCERTYKNGNLTLFTSSCGMNYSNSLEFCKNNEGEVFIPRFEGDNDIMFDFGADFFSKNNTYEFFWYPLKRPTYGEKAKWADGEEFETYETPFYGDSNSNQYRCFVFKHDGESLSTYDQFCRVTNSHPICSLLG